MKLLDMSVWTFTGYTNGSQADVDHAVNDALTRFAEKAKAGGWKVIGKAYAIPQPQLLDTTKLDVVVRALIRNGKRKEV
jgi:hypothetical protein